MRHHTSIAAVVLALLLAGSASAQGVPTVMNYQGRLTDNSPSQNPIDASLPMEFRIYGSPTGMDLEWSESWPAGVTVTGGIFSVLLGSNGSPLPSSLFVAGADRYLEIEINGELLMPRQQLGAAGWAHQAGSALDADSLGGVAAANWQRRVAASCPAGQSIRVIDAAGNVTCEPDDVGGGILVETDPSVASTIADRVPRWDGSALADGSIVDTTAAVAVTVPAVMDSSLDVAGPISTGTRLVENGLFSGVLTDVDAADLPGWTPCYTATYDVPIDAVDVRDNLCTQDLVMLACRPTGSPTLTVAAMGHRRDVFFDVGADSDATHTANGVKWYFGENWSWGYANAADTVNRNSCDIEVGLHPDERLCLHTEGSGGWRCGTTTGLNFDPSREKVVFQRPASGSHVEPNLYDIRTDTVAVPGDLTVAGNLTVTGALTETDPEVSSAIVNRIPVWNGTTLTDSGVSAVGSNLQLGSGGYIDDDSTFGDLPDDWIRLNGYLDLRSDNDNYGIVLRDRDNLDYMSVTQRDGASYLADSTTSFGYFLRGTGADAGVRGNLTVQSDAGSMGTHPTYGATYTAFWRTGSDYALLASTTNTFLNAPDPAAGIYFRTGNVTRASILGSTGELDVPGDVDVGGTVFAGYQIVTSTYSVSSQAACHSHGNLQCYYGSGTATCPAGKVVIGGGTTGSIALYGSVGYSYPSNSTTWACSSSYDLSTTDTCYAICARIGN